MMPHGILAAHRTLTTDPFTHGLDSKPQERRKQEVQEFMTELLKNKQGSHGPMTIHVRHAAAKDSKLTAMLYQAMLKQELSKHGMADTAFHVEEYPKMPALAKARHNIVADPATQTVVTKYAWRREYDQARSQWGAFGDSGRKHYPNFDPAFILKTPRSSLPPDSLEFMAANPHLSDKEINKKWEKMGSKLPTR